MSVDAKFSKRSDMLIYTDITMPNDVHEYVEGEFHGYFKGRT